ncbi:hypothetical protein BH11BAC5_BH11BAC5_29920 [soil metagenome]
MHPMAKKRKKTNRPFKKRWVDRWAVMDDLQICRTTFYNWSKKNPVFCGKSLGGRKKYYDLKAIHKYLAGNGGNKAA